MSYGHNKNNVIKLRSLYRYYGRNIKNCFQFDNDKKNYKLQD